MTLIKSISGIRGTIGGKTGSNLTPLDVVECCAGFGMWIKAQGKKTKVVVGRDGRISGPMVSQIAVQTLLGMGIDIVDLGLSTTPTVEMMVTKLEAGAGIIFTASHNPKEWNALKFLNEKGEFISAEDGQTIIEYIKNKNLVFTDVDSLGTYSVYENHITDHIDEIVKFPYVDVAAIRQAGLSVVVDCINSTGAISIPPLLDVLGVTYTLLNADHFGHFAHNPEPLPAHLTGLVESVKSNKADMGISVDPDVDRLAFVCEDGSLFGEEYTLVAIADYMLEGTSGKYTVSNLSSSRALADVTHKHGGFYKAAAVGEVNVVNTMKETRALIGGEGNGGVIVPGLHYGRDALAGIALFLSYVAKKKKTLTEIKASFPQYIIIKDKISLENDEQVVQLTKTIKENFANEKLNDIDGIKIDFDLGWVHLRKSNTEPIIRIYAESQTQEMAAELIQKVKNVISYV
ncbi:MAG: phosphoglucosamine mutase [Saprospiraceae bacterium]|nr:phosphoglucosamine mutase [Saprospiraceae bacterium]